jgi:hypothetical protein
MGWYPQSAPLGATIAVGAEAGTDIPVTIQLQDAGEADMNTIGVVTAYLSDSAVGDGVAAAGPDGDMAIGTDGSVVVELTTALAWILSSEADGDIDLVFTDSAAFGPVYLVLVLGNGKKVVSGAITFAA